MYNIRSFIAKNKKNLVIARIKAASDDLNVAIGSSEYSKEDLIKSIEKGDDVGKEIIEIQLDYLRDMASGKIYREE